jgi:hypothetical protein
MLKKFCVISLLVGLVGCGLDNDDPLASSSSSTSKQVTFKSEPHSKAHTVTVVAHICKKGDFCPNANDTAIVVANRKFRANEYSLADKPHDLAMPKECASPDVECKLVTNYCEYAKATDQQAEAACETTPDTDLLAVAYPDTHPCTEKLSDSHTELTISCLRSQ